MAGGLVAGGVFGSASRHFAWDSDPGFQQE
jgi:hypothetical protein